jgi:hypothetical protein
MAFAAVTLMIRSNLVGRLTYDMAEWKDEIAWMSLYFSAAVWSSLALCMFYAFAGHLPR